MNISAPDESHERGSDRTAADDYQALTEQRIREVLGHPTWFVSTKKAATIGEFEARFIAHAPFVALATQDGAGGMDCSPRGDSPGFVRMLDSSTLAIPDRVGNKLGDSLVNLARKPDIGLFFLIPGLRETLRINGSAYTTDDVTLRQQLAADGKVPDLVTIVRVEECFLHCGKALIRSGLWSAESQHLAEAFSRGKGAWGLQAVAHGAESAETLSEAAEQAYRSELY